MKQHSNQKSRPRGRSPNNQRKGPSRNQNFDSNGPGVRIRGSAHQVMDKYLTLARDAAGQGDRVLAENYLQHAEHYFRIVQSQQPRTPRITNPAAADGVDGPVSEITTEEGQQAEGDANSNDTNAAQEPQQQRRPARPRRTRRPPADAPAAPNHDENNSAPKAAEAVVEHTTATEAPVVADNGPKEPIAV